MVVRVTESELRALFPNDDGTTSVAPYISDAHALVERLVTPAGTLDETNLEIIERYLAAHFYVLGVQEGGVFQEKKGESDIKTGSSFTLGQGLKLTRWGQMALALDTTGGLAQIEGGKKKTALLRLV